MNINIVALGPVSVGKSTLINALTIEQLSDMKIKRTTAQPQVYKEIDDINKISDLSSIRLKNRLINNDIMTRTENGYTLCIEDIQECTYYIPPIFDLCVLQKDVHLHIYDTPGLNDGRTRDVYFNYVKNNFYKFDIVLFVLDINSALNTSDEMDILIMILEQIKQNNIVYSIETQLIVLLNKCDDMEFNSIENKYMPNNEELIEMYLQAETLIKNQIDLIYSPTKCSILPISCEDAYVYRMYRKNPHVKLDLKLVNKLGTNEYGKTRWNRLTELEKQKVIGDIYLKIDYDQSIAMSGFQQFKSVLQQILNNDGQYTYLCNHLLHDLNQIINYQKLDISDELNKFSNCLTKLTMMNELFGNNSFNDVLLEIVKMYMHKYYEYTTKKYINIIPFTNEEYTVIQKIYDMYSAFISYFIGFIDMGPFQIIHQSFLNNINVYYCNQLKDINCDIEHVQTYFAKLYDNNYSSLYELIVKTLDTNTYILSCSINEYTSIMNKLEQIYNIDYKLITEIAFNRLNETYYTHDIDNKYWNNIIIKSNNPFSDNIKWLKNRVSHGKYTKISNYDFSLDEFIIQRLKHAYPEDIITVDQLIEQYYKQDNVEKYLSASSEDECTEISNNIDTNLYAIIDK